MRILRAVGFVFGLVLVVAVTAVIATGLAVDDQESVESQRLEPSLLTASVEERQLEQARVLRGKVLETVIAQVVATTPDGTVAPVVLKVRPAGSVVHPGDVVVDISGRPVIALKAPFAPYRDLYRGLEGDDVVSLQENLVTLGFMDGEGVDGVFGRLTEDALIDLYEDRGYAAPAPPNEAGPKPTRVRLPVSEVVAIPTDSARVISSTPRVGEVIETGTTLVALGSGQIGFQVTGNAADLAVLEQADDLIIQLDGYGDVFVGTLVEGSVGFDDGQFIAQVAIETDETVAEGTQGTMTATVHVTKDPVLATPSSAIASDSSGQLYVTVVRQGEPQRVDVEVGRTVDGWLEITKSAETLDSGDIVIIGVQ